LRLHLRLHLDPLAISSRIPCLFYRPRQKARFCSTDVGIPDGSCQRRQYSESPTSQPRRTLLPTFIKLSLGGLSAGLCRSCYASNLLSPTVALDAVIGSSNSSSARQRGRVNDTFLQSHPGLPLIAVSIRTQRVFTSSFNPSIRHVAILIASSSSATLPPSQITTFATCVPPSPPQKLLSASAEPSLQES